MAPLDDTGALADLDGDAPAGANLELDADFGALERAAQGAPEKQYGGTIIPAVQPDWREVAALAEALLDRTRDLRVLANLAVARLHVAGPAAFVGVLATIRHQLQTRWDHIHPQLDPDDDNDPTLRANALLPLTDPLRVLRVLRLFPLAVSKRDGAVSWRILAVSGGVVDSDDELEKKTEEVIRAAFNDTGAARIEALRATVATGEREVAGIMAAFDTNSGHGHAPDLTPLAKLLREIGRYLSTYAPVEAAEMPTEDAPEDAPEDVPEDATVEEAPGAAKPPIVSRAKAVTAASLAAVHTRADALRLLDLVCRYYEQYEPSSPLPLMIARARRLADKSFLEILSDLAPDGVGQAQTVVQSRAP